ncbi:thioredoxin domain-containing protein 5-like [Neocloeon triangulifer]|uniref:thioredoxin domain-containing protein 5-like n=1 Tax=Neocloeon triangulifer TaxID=2078957 RepID=UPI00286ECCCE|nr:thioredoxin domain-containing protein 5-like [Neocloeon triangulifer]
MLFKRLCLAPSIILSLTASFVAAHEDTAESVSYTTDAFKEEVAKKNHFVMFYAPWCEHCKRLGPTWNNLAKKFGVGDDAEVVIAQVDCTVETALCSENDVTGYPTLKFFKAGESDGVKFRGSRDSSTLKSFIFEQLGKKDDDDNDVWRPCVQNCSVGTPCQLPLLFSPFVAKSNRAPLNLCVLRPCFQPFN